MLKPNPIGRIGYNGIELGNQARLAQRQAIPPQQYRRPDFNFFVIHVLPSLSTPPAPAQEARYSPVNSAFRPPGDTEAYPAPKSPPKRDYGGFSFQAGQSRPRTSLASSL